MDYSGTGTASGQTTGIHDKVRDYYGKILKSQKDLKTSACCSTEAMPLHVRKIAADIHPEVLDRFYGCGSPIPAALDGATVLDLGCGTGRDVFILSKLVGPNGRVIGVDMTEEQLEVARRHRNYHADKFGYATSNVEFRHGYIENLQSLGLADNSIDVVVSNCVVNLSPDKPSVLREIFRVLKPGGERYFSDVFADRRLPESMRNDAVLVGECLGGALYVEDFRRLLLGLGCPDYRVVADAPVTLIDPDVAVRASNVQFRSLTIRAFKLDLEDRCEDFGQFATYRGTLAESPHRFILDDHHTFETGRAMAICGNTAAMLGKTRFAAHFEIHGDTSQHFGLFPCAPQATQGANANAAGSCC